MGAWREREVGIKGEAGREAMRRVLCSKSEMMTACITMQGDSGDYEKYLASGCQR